MMKPDLRSTVLAAALVLLGLGVAAAQGAGGDASGTTQTPPGVGTTIKPGQGGVGGTGLGNVPAGDQTGKGLSVKGPPGQLVPSDLSKVK